MSDRLSWGAEVSALGCTLCIQNILPNVSFKESKMNFIYFFKKKFNLNYLSKEQVFLEGGR